MKQRETSALPVLEWSPSKVRVWMPGSRQPFVGDSIASVRDRLGEASEVVVAVSRRSSFIRTLRLPDAPKAEVAKILSLQIGTLFPVQPQEVSVDFALTEDRNAEGRLAVVGAVKSDTLKALLDDLAGNGLKARVVVPAALGSALLAKSITRRECAVVEETPEGLSIDIVTDGELRASRVVPMPDPALIDAEISRTFAMAKVPCSETIAAGGFRFPDENLAVEMPGLASLSSGDLSLNLEPTDVVTKREKDRFGRTQRVALLLWVAAFLLAAVIWDQRSSEAAVLAKGDARWRKRFANLQTTKNQAEARLTSLQKVHAALALGFESSQKMGDVVRVLSSLAPEGLWLTGVTLERGKPALIRGTAMSNEPVTKYLEALAGQSRFRDVKLVFANNGLIEKTPVVQFSISAHVVGNLPLDSAVLKK